MGRLAIYIDMPQGSQVSVTGLDGVQDRPTAPAPPSSTPAPPSSTAPPAAAAPGGGPGAVRTWGISTAERAVFTFAASFLSAMVLSGAFNITAAGAALFAGASTALSVVTAAIRSVHPPTDDKGLDVVTRVGLTLLQTFTAAFVTSTAGATHFSDWRAGALAGAAAAFTTAKGMAAVQLNGATGADRATPASLFPLHLGAAEKAGPVLTSPEVA